MLNIDDFVKNVVQIFLALLEYICDEWRMTANKIWEFFRRIDSSSHCTKYHWTLKITIFFSRIYHKNSVTIKASASICNCPSNALTTINFCSRWVQEQINNKIHSLWPKITKQSSSVLFSPFFSFSTTQMSPINFTLQLATVSLAFWR